MLHWRSHGVRSARAAVLQDLAQSCVVAKAPVGKPLSARGKLKAEWRPDHLREALRQAGGYIPEAARILGISRSHGYRLFKRLKEEHGAKVRGAP
jgi:transcriptional regulator of acetoin/glycerol metabolism